MRNLNSFIYSVLLFFVFTICSCEKEEFDAPFIDTYELVDQYNVYPEEGFNVYIPFTRNVKKIELILEDRVVETKEIDNWTDYNQSNNGGLGFECYVQAPNECGPVPLIIKATGFDDQIVSDTVTLNVICAPIFNQFLGSESNSPFSIQLFLDVLSENIPFGSIGVCYSSTTESPTVKDKFVYLSEVEGQTKVERNILIQPLNPSTQYYMRPFVINQFGTFYGKSISVMTGEYIPKVGDFDVKVDNFSTVTASYFIDSYLDVKASKFGVCYVKGEGLPTINDEVVYMDYHVGNKYFESIKGLIQNNGYTFRAFIENEKEIFYSDNRIYVTTPELTIYTSWEEYSTDYLIPKGVFSYTSNESVSRFADEYGFVIAEGTLEYLEVDDKGSNRYIAGYEYAPEVVLYDRISDLKPGYIYTFVFYIKMGNSFYYSPVKNITMPADKNDK